jgi:hypothetical protein
MLLAPPGRNRHLPITRPHLDEPFLSALRSLAWVEMSVSVDPVVY